MPAYLPICHATETTMEEYRRAVLLAERDFWLARWNALRGVHPIRRAA